MFIFMEVLYTRDVYFIYCVYVGAYIYIYIYTDIQRNISTCTCTL